MRRFGVMPGALVMLCLLGCAELPFLPGGGESGAPALPRLARVEVGMSAAEVESLVGTPATTAPDETEPERTYWYYEDGIVIFRDGKVEYSFPEAPPQR